MNEFEYYCDSFGGTVFDAEEEFEPYADRAKRFVRRITCTEPDFENEDILSCVCALAEIYAGCAAGVESEKVDGYEVHYSDFGEALLHTARLYLPPVLMYRGF